MAYDEDLAERLREHLDDTADVTERKMFGGLAFMIGGHMAVVASGQGGLMARVGTDAADELEESTPAKTVVMKGRPMRGWLRIGSDHVASEEDLGDWVSRSKAFVRTLPPK